MEKGGAGWQVRVLENAQKGLTPLGMACSGEQDNCRGAQCCWMEQQLSASGYPTGVQPPATISPGQPRGHGDGLCGRTASGAAVTLRSGPSGAGYKPAWLSPVPVAALGRCSRTGCQCHLVAGALGLLTSLLPQPLTDVPRGLQGHPRVAVPSLALGSERWERFPWDGMR